MQPFDRNFILFFMLNKLTHEVSVESVAKGHRENPGGRSGPSSFRQWVWDGEKGQTALITDPQIQKCTLITEEEIIIKDE